VKAAVCMKLKAEPNRKYWLHNSQVNRPSPGSILKNFDKRWENCIDSLTYQAGGKLFQLHGYTVVWIAQDEYP
jgi:hypothetical protein